MIDKVILFGVVFSVLTTIGAVEAQADCSGVTCKDVSIDRLYVDSTGILIQTSGDETNLHCDPGANNYIKLKMTHPNYVQVARVLEDAHRTGHTIMLRMESPPGLAPCTLSYVVSDR